MDKADDGRVPGLANLEIELQDSIAIVRLARPQKRNALNDETVFSLWSTGSARRQAKSKRWFSLAKVIISVPDWTYRN